METMGAGRLLAVVLALLQGALIRPSAPEPFPSAVTNYRKYHFEMHPEHAVYPGERRWSSLTGTVKTHKCTDF